MKTLCLSVGGEPVLLAAERLEHDADTPGRLDAACSPAVFRVNLERLAEVWTDYRWLGPYLNPLPRV